MSTEAENTAPGDKEYSLDELSRLADVTPRTVRYYIVEGLLPPPFTTGRNATYGQEHLDRLNAIAAMKEMYLPLREIRHRLNTLTPEQMRDPALLASLSQAVTIDRAMSRHHEREGRRHRDEYPGDRHREHRRGEHRGPARSSEPRMFRAEAPAPSIDVDAARAPQTWERFPLGEDAEVLIRSSRVQHMGPGLYRTLHRLRQIIEADPTDQERNRS